QSKANPVIQPRIVGDAGGAPVLADGDLVSTNRWTSALSCSAKNGKQPHPVIDPRPAFSPRSCWDLSRAPCSSLKPLIPMVHPNALRNGCLSDSSQPKQQTWCCRDSAKAACASERWPRTRKPNLSAASQISTVSGDTSGTSVLYPSARS